MIIIDLGFKPDKCKVPAKDTKRLYSAACSTFMHTQKLFGTSCSERMLNYAADNIRTGILKVPTIRKHLYNMADVFDTVDKARRGAYTLEQAKKSAELISTSIKTLWADWLTLEQTEALLETL